MAFTPTEGLPLALALGATLALACGVLTGLLVERLALARLRAITSFLEAQRDERDLLKRLAPLGDDEIGRAAVAVNGLLAHLTTQRASLIEQGRELAATQRELRLSEELAKNTEQLEARLRERELLFDVLRVSASEIELDRVLATLAARLGPELRLRELALLIREGDRFAIRAVHGFETPELVLGRGIAEGEGVAGQVARTRGPVVVPDVTEDDTYLAFWGEAEREGSFAAIPILQHDQFIGILAATRPPDEEFTDAEVRYLRAIADQVALVIRHAQLIEELRELSTHDDLTKLGNRRLLHGRFGMEIERARRFDQPLSVLALDLDHFKKLNDRLGHATGDDALREVARVLTQWIRRVDTVARIGGEEFVVLLPRAGVLEAARVAEKLRAQVAEIRLGDELVPLSVSIGVAELASSDDAESLLARADDALYFAKDEGRDRVAIYETPDAKGPRTMRARLDQSGTHETEAARTAAASGRR